MSSKELSFAVGNWCVWVPVRVLMLDVVVCLRWVGSSKSHCLFSPWKFLKFKFARETFLKLKIWAGTIILVKEQIYLPFLWFFFKICYNRDSQNCPCFFWKKVVVKVKSSSETAQNAYFSREAKNFTEKKTGRTPVRTSNPSPNK